MKHPLISSSIAIAFVFNAAIAMASPGRGLEIAKAQKAKNVGWNDSQSEMTMILRTANGRENTRNISLKSLEVSDDGDKSLMIFNEPKDVKGTAFLSFSHVATPDDQWIFLPALKRIKRISSKKKSGSFMGSEFSYEDLASFEIAKYTFTYLRDEKCGELVCHVLKSIPTDPYSGYTKLISWIDTKELRTQKVDFYDRKNNKLKTMKTESYRLYSDKYWRPIVSQMINYQTGKSTTLKWSGIRLSTGLTKEDFSKNSLKRAK